MEVDKGAGLTMSEGKRVTRHFAPNWGPGGGFCGRTSTVVTFPADTGEPGELGSLDEPAPLELLVLSPCTNWVMRCTGSTSV